MGDSLSADHLRTLRHMLGIDTDTPRKPYRDRYLAQPGCPKMGELEALGAVRRGRTPSFVGDLELWVTTEAGRAAAIGSHEDICSIVPKKRRTYRRFLAVKDACPDLTFREFLTSQRREVAGE